jgi:ribonuclease D
MARRHRELENTLKPPDTIPILTGSRELAALAERMAREPRIAFDLEANGFFSYPEHICLIQVGFDGMAFLIDPLSIDDMAPLGRILGDPKIEKILHSADYDVRSLDRDWGFKIDGLFDTSIAAAFAGMDRLGLGTVAMEVLGVELPKSKRLQRANWGLRPLTEEAINYAAGDVLHLMALRDSLGKRLTEKGRTEWVAEECVRLAGVSFNTPDPELAFLSVKGSKGLDGKALAILRSLHAYRLSEALRRNVPPFKIVSDAVLEALAEAPDQELAKVKSIGPYGRGELAHEVKDALEEGLQAPPVKRPPRATGIRMTAAHRDRAKDRLTRLKAWRTEQGKALELDPALLWPAPSLERLSRDNGDLDEEFNAPEVRRWQAKEFGEPLRKFLADIPHQLSLEASK